MPYLPRKLIIDDDSHFHVTWQCHNNDWLLGPDWAKKLYYDLLLTYKDRYGITIHSYSLMDTHPHITGHLRTIKDFSAFFRQVNGLFARTVNKRLKRRGQVVMQRFKSPKIESDRHMLSTMTYIDLNPCRAGIVMHPGEYRWSSYAYYAEGKPDPLITPSPSYLELASNDKARSREYKNMVEEVLRQKKRMNISSSYFIGDPKWVSSKYKELCLRLNVAMKLKKYLHGTDSSA